MKSLLFLFLLLFISVLLHAQQSGTLDPAFGNKGILIDTTSKQALNDPLAIQADGKILSATTDVYQGYQTFRIDRFLTDGTKDPSFGNEGSAFVLFHDFGSSSFDGAAVSALIVQPDGKIVAAGYASGEDLTGLLGLVRLMPDGTLDSSFGISGTIEVGDGNIDEVQAIALQPDGKILVGGEDLVDFINGIYKFYTVRCLSDGTMDKTYGKGGFLLSKSVGDAKAIAVQPDGKIIAAGYSGSLFTHSYFHIERYNTDGSYDKNFGNGDGIVDTTVGVGSCAINSLALQPDGKMVIGGGSNGYFPTHFTVARYNSDGSIDKSFGEDGSARPFAAGSEATTVLLTGEKGDKIVATGTISATGGDDFALAGYNTDGTLDAGFGNEGTQTTDLGASDDALTAALQPDGKIVMLGYQYQGVDLGYVRALARYYGYPQKVSLLVRIKRFLQNHGISWNGLPAEDKIAYYSVEQSSNSRSGFAQIAKVSGRSNLPDYSITNSSLLQGMNYYRVKAVSTDGVVRYSEVVSADNSANTASVFPNPANSYVTVQGLPLNETANISIKDGSGTVLARGVTNGSTQYRSQLSNNMQPGTYYLNITTATKTEVLKFVKE